MSTAKRTPVSSPLPASTSSVSTPVVDSASVPASAHVWAVTPTPLSGTTEKNFSVDKYFDLQEKKLEVEAKPRAGAAKPDSAKTIFDGSSIFSADGGIPVDYEDGELEDEDTSSSLSHESKPASGTRRPREDDSNASSSKGPRSASDAVLSGLEALAIISERDATRTDDSVREPWMPFESVIKDRRIVDDAEAAAKRFEPTTNQRRDYYISLFYELRYWSSKKTSGRSRVPEWQALCQSWNQFVANFNNGPAAYRERIASARERFMRFSKTSAVQRFHEGSVNANIPCAVPEGIHCPHRPTGAPRISERDLTGYTTNRVPANVKELRAKLACTRQHPSVVTEHNTPRITASAVLRLQSVVGFVRLHHFRNVRHQDVSGKPRISKETRFSPTNTKTNRTSVRLRTGMVNNPIHLAVDCTADRAMLLSAVHDAHHMVNPGLTTALHVRVEAVERVKVSQMAELRQELFFQKAYVAEAAQSTSNIRVEVLEQVRLLQEKKLQLHLVQIERLLVARGQSPLLES
ncbi:LOW QUALITY PROTEIN: hypothetical protein PHMEG_00016655 [Phytophthora megakarya]|uniref:Uncharacterized protein n=1 Tax=Phytophthora megakarya TaxID=4795 RepID=A0A225VZY7_9STRA|nr:LOW QUALITY PROTEIN: hypothetical protein PHMEG_00016655 [Phytophthora megakarya]